MSATFYLAGHEGFYNRGCEALVRSIVQIVGQRLVGAKFVVPSNDLDFDRRQWPDADRDGVRFVAFPSMPSAVRWWSRAYKLSPRMAGAWMPRPDLASEAAAELARCDAVIVTGGDVLSLDYSAGSLLRWVAQCEAALRRRVPVVLWASSIGPFSRDPRIESLMQAHLARYASLSTRESHSQAYLQGLGLRQSVLTADPAFVLQPQPVDAAGLLPAPGPEGLLGFNISPVMARARGEASIAALEDETIRFWRHAIEERGLGVALIPHVDPPSGTERQSDTAYMRRLVQRSGDFGGRLSLAPSTLNAGQLKTLLASCRYFIGARTHATIGAMSSGVPTLSIAYSVKARGINADLFGDLRYMLETPAVSYDTLVAGLQRLGAEERDIKALLADRIPEWKRRAARTGELLASVVEARGASPIAA
jgi:polysaccharide pyruvyl transferase WcaK-like protein